MDILRWSLRWLSAAAAVIVPRPGNVVAIVETAQGLGVTAAAAGGAVGAPGAAQGIDIAFGRAGAAGGDVAAVGSVTAVLELGELP
ncbi:MAG: hypothetical protein H6661_10040 [Ardenticatenaceae bacterium]|nr:hypothetical protein [Ardenticatenaceae bacterium]